MSEKVRLQNKAHNAYETWKAANNNPAITSEEESFFFNQYREAQNEYADYIDNDWLKV